MTQTACKESMRYVSAFNAISWFLQSCGALVIFFFFSRFFY